MSENTLASLRDILAHLYPDETSARRVVEDAGIDPLKITFTSHAKNNWHAILEEARKVYRDDALLDIVLSKHEYGDNTTLQKAVSTYRTTQLQIDKNKLETGIYNYFSPTSAASERDDASPCPYKGLLHFGPDDANFFFGREKVIGELVQLTNKRTAIPILGASGSGKSSLVLAGLVPALQRCGGWKFVHFRPGNDPFLSLAKALMPLYEPTLTKREQTKEARKIADDLRNNHLTIADIMEGVQREAGVQGRLLLIADQFEELYTLCPDEKVHHQFLDNLIQSCQPIDLPSSLVIIFALRADFLAVALNNPAFAEVLRFDVKLGPMTQAELGQAIEVPAQKLGVSFEDGLVERIRQAVENKPGNLPLLEFALSLLWENRTGEQITHNAYEAIGQVEGALARHANEQYDRLTDREKELTQYIFTQLVHPGRGTEDTRQIAIMNDLDKNTWPVIRKLADLRLVVTSQNANGQETVEVVHEALIQNWGKLGEWMNKIRAFRVWQEQLRFELKRWDTSGQNEGALLRGAFLVEAKDWLKERPHDLGQAEHNFIQVSIKQYEEEQQGKKEAERNRLVLMIRIQGAANLDLSQADLEGVNLQGANLSRADLLSANLSYADLLSANLSYADLLSANLRNADLRGTNLQGANLSNTDLSNTDLRYTDLRGANLLNTNLRGANLQGANLSNTDLSNTDLSNTDLSNTDLRYTDLRGANLLNTNLRGANLLNARYDSATKWAEGFGYKQSGAIGPAAILRKVDLSKANLRELNLSRADLSNANLSGAVLSGGDLRSVNLSRADLRNANLSGAVLSGADLRKADLRKADLRKADLRSADLRGANLVGTKLRELNLSRADLSNANLSGVVLSKADLSGANLSEANLSGADLRNAKYDRTTKWPEGFDYKQSGAIGPDTNLSGADLRRADLSNANLSGADLSGADLRGADLSGADLRRADLRNAKYDRTTKWPEGFDYKQSGAIGPDANLSGADLRKTDLSRVNLVGVNLVGTNLRELNLSRADLSNANLSGVVLSKADLRSADLSGANLSGADLLNADLLNADLRSADLRNADLSSADLSSADLRGANLVGTKLQNARYNSTTKWPEGFDYKQSGAIGPDANLSGADLRKTDLRGIDLRNTHLSGADLSGADLSGADLRNAKYDRTTKWPEGFDPDSVRMIKIN